MVHGTSQGSKNKDASKPKLLKSEGFSDIPGMRASDPLYSIFEQHLMNALIEEETTEDFVSRVVGDYLGRLGQVGSIPRNFVENIESDLKDEVLEMLRKRTYGHFSLDTFRKNERVRLERQRSKRSS